MRNPAKDPEPAADGGVTAVTRALSILEAFEVGESTLALAELSRRSGMHKTTVLRLARTLAHSQYMVQTDDGQWRLGPAAGWLGARYQAGFDVNNAVEPVLHQLVKETGESARVTATTPPSAGASPCSPALVFRMLDQGALCETVL